MNPDERLELPYYYGQESEQFSFYRIPKALFSNPVFADLSTDAKLLYGMLLDRMGLSVRNHWMDEQGRVFIYYTVENIMRDLGCGNQKVSKLLAELEKKKDTEIQLLKDKQKELEFLNAMLSDRLTLAQRKQFGASSEKYAEGYEQMNLFNEAEASADAETEELFEEIRPSSYKRKKRKGKKEEDLSNFETVETRTYKLEGEARYCPECGKKYSVVTKETVKRLRFVPAKFEVEEEITYVYSCPKCGAMKRPEKEPSLIRGSIATPSLVAGIMNAKYVNGMPLARQEREFARYDLDLSTKTMANWIINCADRYLKPLYQLMKEELLESRYIHCDESRIQVLGEPEQKGTTQNWMWVYLTDEFSGSPQIVVVKHFCNTCG